MKVTCARMRRERRGRIEPVEPPRPCNRLIRSVREPSVAARCVGADVAVRRDERGHVEAELPRRVGRGCPVHHRAPRAQRRITGARHVEPYGRRRRDRCQPHFHIHVGPNDGGARRQDEVGRRRNGRARVPIGVGRHPQCSVFLRTDIEGVAGECHATGEALLIPDRALCVRHGRSPEQRQAGRQQNTQRP
jgi:hypothetical protein